MFKFNVSLKIAVCIINVMRVVDYTPMIRQGGLGKSGSVAILVALSGLMCSNKKMECLIRLTNIFQHQLLKVHIDINNI